MRVIFIDEKAIYQYDFIDEKFEILYQFKWILNK
jgi:hypothetical protein